MNLAHPTSRHLLASYVAVLPLVLGLAAVSLPSSASAQTASARPEQQRLELAVGEQVTIAAAGVASYSEGAPGIVDVRVPSDGRQFIIVALRPGTTSLLLIYGDGRQVRYAITVLDPEASVTSTGGVPARESIRLDLYFVQLTEQYSHSLGIGFPGTIGGSSQTASFQGQLSFVGDTGPTAEFTRAAIQIANQSLPRLEIAQTSGWIRIMRQAMVVTANGMPAEINAGGEVNFVVTNAFQSQILRIQYGSQIVMTPRYDSSTGRVEVQLQADVSELTPAFDESGIPGRTTTHIVSTLNLELGQSIVVGGALARYARQSASGLPGLSQIPIIGVLFGVNERVESTSESLLFIVPTVVQPVPRAQADRISEALRVYESFGSIGGPGLGDIELFEPSPPGYE